MCAGPSVGIGLALPECRSLAVLLRHTGYPSRQAWAVAASQIGHASKEETEMTENPAGGQSRDELGGPEPDEERTDLLGGSGSASDELGGPEPDEARTDLMGGSDKS